MRLKNTCKLLALLVFCCFVASPATADTLEFSDTFSNLDNWTSGSGRTLFIFGRDFVYFDEVTSGGDIWTNTAFGPGQYRLEFQYWGSRLFDPLPDPMPVGGLGGFIGVATGQTKESPHAWLGGTWTYWARAEFGIDIEPYTPVQLQDTGVLGSYEISFTMNESFYLMLEDYHYESTDWDGDPFGIPNDAFFDNVNLYLVEAAGQESPQPNIENPLPGAAWLLLSGLPALYAARRRKKS